MSDFNADYQKISTHELVRYLLRESGQDKPDNLNPSSLVDLLKLNYISFNFDSGLPEEVRVAGKTPRALLSFADKIIASHSELSDNRTRFSVLHEIAHYVLPNHEHAFYLCNEEVMQFSTKLQLEKQANEFASDLLFMADQFTNKVNSQQICAATIKTLAENYQASFEATARRLVEKNLKPCMLVVFEKRNDRSRIDPNYPPIWEVRYCVASESFQGKYCTKIQGPVPADVAIKLTTRAIDFANSERRKIIVNSKYGTSFQCEAEFFFNTYNIFCLLIPAKE